MTDPRRYTSPPMIEQIAEEVQLGRTERADPGESRVVSECLEAQRGAERIPYTLDEMCSPRNDSATGGRGCRRAADDRDSARREIGIEERSCQLIDTTHHYDTAFGVYERESWRATAVTTMSLFTEGSLG